MNHLTSMNEVSKRKKVSIKCVRNLDIVPIVPGTNINSLDKAYLKDINLKINDKKRKILGYLPASLLFKNELSSIFNSSDINFYL